MFRFITTAYNCEKYIANTIKSIKAQNNTFKSVIVDDSSTDNTLKVINDTVGDDDRFVVVSNQDNKKQLHNIVQAINLHGSIADDDIIVWVDGDDWLPNNKVLEILERTYTQYKCLCTYSNFVSTRGEIGWGSEYPQTIKVTNRYREWKWSATHLRTFKYKLWKNLNIDDLRDESGEYYIASGDFAVFIPLLEMSGVRNFFIDEILYVYNTHNPLNVHKLKKGCQLKIEQEIRSKKKYDKVDFD